MKFKIVLIKLRGFNMINISSIKTNMYCPMKLYNETYNHLDKTEQIKKALEIKKIKLDIEDLMQKNMRKIKKEMTIKDIENTISQNITAYIKNSITTNITDNEINEILKESCFNIKITSLKAKQAMELTEKDGSAIKEMIYPNSMYSYQLKDPQLDLIGVCDKIEIIDGKYYPVSIKNKIPPLKGVWNPDAVELVANAILIEEEFDTEVFVGFIHYTKINEKRPVIMDVTLRRQLFDVINEVKEITENKKYPKVKINEKKCRHCQYFEKCSENKE